MIEVRLLEHTLAVADEGSFAVAAQVLGISQPALSRSIQSLEAQLGMQLFERGHRRIEPTDAGQIFLERAREIVARHEALSREMGLLGQDQSASFVLAVGPYVANQIAGPALARMVGLYPQIQFQLRVASWSEAVKLARSREADMTVSDISQVEDDPELELTPLEKAQGYFVVRAGHPLLKLRKPSLSQVLTYPLVITARLPPRIRVPLQQGRGGRRNGYPGAFPAILCEDLSVVSGIVTKSDTVSIFVLPLIERELAEGTLAVLDCDAPWLHTQFGIARLRGRPLAPYAHQLCQFLQEASAAYVAKNRQLAGRSPARVRRRSG